MELTPKVVSDFQNIIQIPENGIVAFDEKMIVPKDFSNDFDRILISKKCLALRLEALADQIAADYKDEIFAAVILKGAVIFFSDLARALAEREVTVRYDVMVANSYVDTESTGEINIRLDVSDDIQGKDVLIVEDIIDTGTTLKRLQQYFLEERQVNSVKICAFMDKKARRQVEVNVDYVGFEVPNHYLVGYGLDFNQHYRSLPYVAVLHQRVYEK